MSWDNCVLWGSSILVRSSAPAAVYTFLLFEGVEVLVESYLLKNSSSPFILISTIQRSTTLLALLLVFSKDCLFTCIFHSL